MRSKWLVFLVAVPMIFGCAAKSSAQEKTVQTPPDTTRMVLHEEAVYEDTTVGEFTLKWKVDTLELLHIRVSAPTTGWVAVGFNPTSLMKDANLIIGYVKEGTAYFSEEFGTRVTSHKPDTDLGGQDNLVEKEGEENEGRTYLHFAIPLDSGDRYDRVLEPGKTYKIILAYGPNGADNFTTKHRKATSVKITL